MEFNPITIIITLLILTIIVAVHEFGHFITAKFFKMDVREFSIGFGKVLFQKFYKGTNYSIRLIPLGGFVELEGEKSSDSPNSFRNHPYYQKVIVLVAGVVMNILLAIVLLAAYLGANNYKFPIVKLAEYNFSNVVSQEVYSPINVLEISEDSEVKEYISRGDIIVKINGSSFKSYEDFSKELTESQGALTTLTLLNPDTFDTDDVEFTTPFADENGAILKATLSPSNQLAYFLMYQPSIISGISMTYDIFVYQIQSLGNIFQSAFNSGNYTEVAQSLGGVVQVAGAVNTLVVVNDLSFLVALTAFISISLAFFNILPIPALDGGHILIITLERIMGRKLSDKWLNILSTGGFILLITLAILITFKDVIQLINPF